MEDPKFEPPYICRTYRNNQQDVLAAIFAKECLYFNTNVLDFGLANASLPEGTMWKC